MRNISLAEKDNLKSPASGGTATKCKNKSVGKRRSGFCVQWTTTVNALEEVSVECSTIQKRSGNPMEKEGVRDRPALHGANRSKEEQRAFFF